MLLKIWSSKFRVKSKVHNFNALLFSGNNSTSFLIKNQMKQICSINRGLCSIQIHFILHFIQFYYSFIFIWNSWMHKNALLFLLYLNFSHSQMFFYVCLFRGNKVQSQEILFAFRCVFFPNFNCSKLGWQMFTLFKVNIDVRIDFYWIITIDFHMAERTLN